MIDIIKAKKEFKNYLNQYEDKKEHPNFKLKVTHTYHVADNSKNLATNLNLDNEEIDIAELIGILHDIGRFEELRLTGEYNSLKFNHAEYGCKILFEDNYIRRFIDDNKYDNLIKKAIENHSSLVIEDGLDN